MPQTIEHGTGTGEFRRLAIPGGELRVCAESVAELAELGLLDPRRWRTADLPGKLLQQSARGLVMRVRAGSRSLFAKYQRPRPGFAELLRGSRSSSPAERERSAAACLAGLGLATPRFLLAGETRARSGRVRESFLLSEVLPGRTLERADAELTGALSSLLALLSRERIHVPDLYAKHLLLDPGRSPALGLVDLERVVARSRRGARSLFVRHAAGLVATLPGLDARELAQALDPQDAARLVRRIEARAELVRVRKKLPRDLIGRHRYRDEAAVHGYRARSSSRHAAELRLLSAVLPVPLAGTVLDAPCGAGRFSEILGQRGARTLALDLSPAMMRHARSASSWCALGELERLPLRDRAVEGALCFRFLHHVPGREQRLRILRELTRVSRRFVVLSFFHPFSAHHVLRRLRSLASGEPLARHACRLSALRAELGALGWRIVRVSAQAPFRRDLWALRAEPDRAGPPGRD